MKKRAKQRRLTGKDDPRIAERFRELKSGLRESLGLIDRTSHIPTWARDLARQLFILGERQRIFRPGAWAQVEQVDRGVLIAMVSAALLTALDCGMTKRQFVAWLRRTAININDGFYPST